MGKTFGSAYVAWPATFRVTKFCKISRNWKKNSSSFVFREMWETLFRGHATGTANCPGGGGGGIQTLLVFQTNKNSSQFWEGLRALECVILFPSCYVRSTCIRKLLKSFLPLPPPENM